MIFFVRFVRFVTTSSDNAFGHSREMREERRTDEARATQKIVSFVISNLYPKNVH